MARNRITKKWLKNHWAYSWWKYLLLTVVCVMGVNVLFTVTAYRAPEEKKIEVFITNGYIDQTAIEADFSPVFFEHFPEQEELRLMNVNLSGNDAYARMQYSTYIAAQQGDVLMLTESEVLMLASDAPDGAFIELTPYIESGVIDLDAVGGDVLSLRNEEGVEGIYAVSADSLQGLTAFGHCPEGSYLCITAFSGNEDTAAGVIALMLERYRDVPDGAQQEGAALPPVLF